MTDPDLLRRLLGKPLTPVRLLTKFLRHLDGPAQYARILDQLDAETRPQVEGVLTAAIHRKFKA